MIKTLWVVLLSLVPTCVYASTGGRIGAVDNRVYADMADPKYHSIVRLTSKQGVCTGVFVSPNLILTNAHCVIQCVNGECKAQYWNGTNQEDSNLTVVRYDKDPGISDGNDWALLKSDKISNFYRPISAHSTAGEIMSGGFGMLRIIKDNEIDDLKKVYKKVTSEYQTECKNTDDFIACINVHVDKELKNQGMEPLWQDTGRFKAKNCEILGEYNGKMLRTNCDGAAGDSGSAMLRNEQIVGLNNSIYMDDVFGADSEKGMRGLKTENFYDDIQIYAKRYAVDSGDKLGAQDESVDGENVDFDEAMPQYLEKFKCD
ncbi:MAG: trypsin-like serine protease [Alphaproteobacteria bacterium]|nr:trypsin-like serine protease [Alphaproteobacteria bacterium]